MGHFVAAKAVGIQVLRFSLGFGRPIFAWRRGETEYWISWIPLGGYVDRKSTRLNSSHGYISYAVFCLKKKKKKNKSIMSHDMYNKIEQLKLCTHATC